MKSKIFFLFFLIKIKIFLSDYFESFQHGNISENASIIDITDYNNLFLLITTEKNIYKGITPNKISETQSKIMNISAAATYDNNFILLACSEDYLLSKINIISGEEIFLLSYAQFNLSIEFLNYYSCSICLSNNIAYIGIPQTFNGTLTKNIIKVELSNPNDNNGPIVNNQMIYSFDYQLTNLNNITFSRQISCEIIYPKDSPNDEALICGYILFDNTTLKYSYKAGILNSQFNKLDEELMLSTQNNLLSFRLQKINSTYIRYLIKGYSFEIYISKSSDGKFKLAQTSNNQRNPNLYSFSSFNDLFYYHNQYIFSSFPTDINNIVHFYLYIKSNISSNYIRITFKNTFIHKVIGYYDNNNDKFLFIYQFSDIIKFFTLQNMSFLFYFQCNTITKEVISNTQSIFNITELITYPLEHELLYQAHVVTYNTTTYRVWSYNKHHIFNKTSQILTVYPSLNDWVTFYYYFYGGTLDRFILYFALPSCLIHVRTCAYKCGSCSDDFNICDEGTCKKNFSKLRDSEDTECYPNDQNFPNYINDLNTSYYEKCYSSCIFCSLKNLLSSNLSHNFLACNEGYLRSYEYMGNCYKIEYPYNKSNFYKIVNNSEEENFTLVDSCLNQKNKYIIVSTGECVSKCPSETVYHTYKYIYRNFSKQLTSVIDKMYPLSLEKVPKFLFGNLCYEECPESTIADINNNLCKCIYAWEQNYDTKNITCYDNKEYCLSNNFYYHLDTKECVLYNCRENYYQFNFECNNNNCPENSSLISNDNNKCESDLNYCYIDENFKTHCSDEQFSEYNLQYKDSKIYFKSCNESLYFFNIKTYLYKNICYENCPEETIINDTNNRCSCKYFKIYLNGEKNDYECLTVNETCKEKNKYPIIDTKECIDYLQECKDLNFKIFNEECYINCPENTVEQYGDCLCSFSYYNKSNFLICYSKEKTCQSENYPFKKMDEKECFNNKEECIERDFKIFNNICYEECPFNTELKYNDNICYCSYNYFNDSNSYDCFNINETCEFNNFFYTNLDTNECFNLIIDCINRGYKIFNNNCYNSCPINTENNKDDFNYCNCSYYYHIDENKYYNCFDSDKTCENEGYSYTNEETKECFENEEKCILKGYKIFNKKCYDKCPINSDDENNDHFCECTFYFYKNNDLYDCFSSEKTCESAGYEITGENKECFKSIEECLSNNYSYYYHNYCFKNNCSFDKIPLNSIQNNTIKNELIKELELNNNLFSDNLCICDTNNTYSGWINNISNPSIQICLEECPETFELDLITHKCFYCNPKKDYYFNDICYKDKCPVGTQLDSSNINSRICICEELSIINYETGLIQCKEKEYPSEFFEDHNSCQFIYKGNCYQKCPDNTCLTQNREDLTKCVDIKENMKVFNGICFEDIEEITKNIENIKPKTSSSGITINAYNTEEDIDELMKINPNLTYVDLGDCNDKLKQAYNLPSDTKLFVLGIDTPNLLKSSSINNFNFEIYLSNGTQIKNKSACENIKISISSYIKEPESIKFDKAIEFSNLGYDIYNKTNIFYTDACSPAADNGNDITLNDRMKYYYPSNISICNEGCDYVDINYEMQRFICECNAYNNETNKQEEKINKEEEEYEQSYLEYFLSLINYKIIICNNLFFQFSSFYYNAGFYISFSTLLICIILMMIFWKLGIKKIRIIFYRNIPTKIKLEELFKKQEKKRNENLNNEGKMNIINCNKSSISDIKKDEHNTIYGPSINIIRKPSKRKTVENNKNDNIFYLPKNNNKNALYIDNNGEKDYNQKNNFNEKDIIITKIRGSKSSAKIELNNQLNNQSFDGFESNDKIISLIENIKNEKNCEKKIMKKSFKNRKRMEKSNNHKLIYLLNKNEKSSKRNDETYKQYNNNKTKLNLDNMKYNEEKDKEEELNLDINFDHLIKSNDDEIDRREINVIPFKQALRLDKRSFLIIFISVLTNQIGALNLFYYINPYSHFSLKLSIYLFELLLDLTMNCFLYTDDVVSEKFHNDGQLTILTSLTLSVISNIISSIVVFIISKITNYEDLIEAIIKYVKNKRNFFNNLERLLKYIKIRVGFYFFLQLLFIFLMTYYLFIFCTVYHQSQRSIMVNYIIGTCISLATSVGLTIIITTLRILSLKYKHYNLYNTSRYIYEHF